MKKNNIIKNSLLVVVVIVSIPIIILTLPFGLYNKYKIVSNNEKEKDDTQI